MDRSEEAIDKLQDLEKRTGNVDLDDFEEFMRKVEEVNKIVHALNSEDRDKVVEATRSADQWLEKQSNLSGKKTSSKKEMVEVVINDEKITNKNVDRTVINGKVSKEAEEKKESLDNLTSEAMTPEAFMKSVEEDANKRKADRLKRIKESDPLKMEANLAFRNQDYEKALHLYNKAIDLRKDSLVLYNNRALTLLNLGLYSKALNDTEWALKLDERSLKARLYKARALFEMGEEEKSQQFIEETRAMFPENLDDIKEYKDTWKKSDQEYDYY